MPDEGEMNCWSGTTKARASEPGPPPCTAVVVVVTASDVVLVDQPATQRPVPTVALPGPAEPVPSLSVTKRSNVPMAVLAARP